MESLKRPAMVIGGSKVRETSAKVFERRGGGGQAVINEPRSGARL